MKALFVCGRNRLRSPTAAAVFAAWPDVDTDSAGLNPDADVVLSADQIEWADVIFVMERPHRAKLKKQFPNAIKDKRVICLDIADTYAFMQSELIRALAARAGPALRQR